MWKITKLSIIQAPMAGGGFLGKAEDALTSLSNLVPQLVNHVKIPIVAAGRIMDGREIAAALALGAVSVQMGTAFLTCTEAGIPTIYKQELLAQRQDNTTLTRAFSGKLARGVGNKFIDRMNKKKANILDYPIQNKLTQAMRKKALEQGNIDFMSMWAGQSAALCKEMGASELINTLAAEMVN